MEVDNEAMTNGEGKSKLTIMFLTIFNQLIMLILLNCVERKSEENSGVVFPG